MNRFNIIGYVANDITIDRTEGKNIAFTKFQVGVKDRGTVDFLPVIAWRGVATNIEKYAKKGDQIGLSGKIKAGKYEDKDGKMVYYVNLKIEEVTFIGGVKVQKMSTLPNESNEETEGIYFGDTDDPVNF